jgi:putative two-component system hydrogenase maturation factor HypX/HoxX
LLPRRVGWDCAIELSENGLPLSANRAKQLRLVDEVMNRDRAAFVEEVHEFAKSKLNLVPYLTAKKRLRRQADEQKKPLAAYRQHELRQMYKNFYSPNSPYHLARATFVRKQPACWSPLSARIMESVGLINSENETQDSRLAAE